MINIFDDIVDLYDSSRPGYPQELFENIIAYSKINLFSKILEVGAGTGQATSFFANHGYKIHALEIGQKQVAYLTEKYKSYSNVCISREKFETVSPFVKFDLIVAASSFHWIDKTIRYKKAYTIMNVGGTLAQFWHMHPVQKFNGGIFDEINDIYHMYFRNKEFYDDAGLRELNKKRMYQLTFNNFEEVSFMNTGMNTHIPHLNTLHCYLRIHTSGSWKGKKRNFYSKYTNASKNTVALFRFRP